MKHDDADEFLDDGLGEAATEEEVDKEELGLDDDDLDLDEEDMNDLDLEIEGDDELGGNEGAAADFDADDTIAS